MPLRRRRNRDTVDGRFVTAAQAQASPATTVTETVSGIPAAASELCKQLRMNGDLDRIRPISLDAYHDLMTALNQ